MICKYLLRSVLSFFVAKENTYNLFFCRHGTAGVCGIFTVASVCAGT